VFALTRSSGRRKVRRLGRQSVTGRSTNFIRQPTTLLSAADTVPCRGDERERPRLTSVARLRQRTCSQGLDVKNAHAAREIRSADPALWARSSLISFLSCRFLEALVAQSRFLFTQLFFFALSCCFSAYFGRKLLSRLSPAQVIEPCPARSFLSVFLASPRPICITGRSSIVPSRITQRIYRVNSPLGRQDAEPRC